VAALSPPRSRFVRSPDAQEHGRALASEFDRAASSFAKRTKGRFDDMDVVAFSRVRAADTVVEVGAGTGNFLSLFAPAAARLVALDITPGMLMQARKHHGGLHLVAGDGLRLPLASASVELAASAQTLHHVIEPVPFLMELRRIVARRGRVLVVDQVATERFEEIAAMNELERLRDPSHAASRPPSAFRIMLSAAGLRIIDERVVTSRSRLSEWMWPGEYPPERIDAVAAFIARRGVETGMGFERDADDWVFQRPRIMLLAERA
jgi:ubiquinone/menaquinone biosynthesis C-methylase UbiE